MRCQRGSEPASSPTAWARLGASLVDFAEARGVPRQRLLAAGGLRRDALETDDSRIPLRSLYDMVEAVARSTGDEHLGLHLAQSDPNGIEALGFLMCTCPTLGAALHALVRYQRLLTDGASYRMERGDRVVRLSMRHHGAPHPAQRHVTELAFYELTAGSVRRLGRSIPGVRVEFRRPRPARPRVYHQVYGERVVFDAGADRIIMPAAALELTLPGSNPSMRAYFERQLGAAMTLLPPPTLARQVQVWIEQNLAAGPGLPDVARALGVSARTLQRRLRAEGHTVRAMVDAARRERAHQLLLATGAIPQTARELGYSEPSAFHRAFKRWTGQTPGAVLARHRELVEGA